MHSLTVQSKYYFGCSFFCKQHAVWLQLCYYVWSRWFFSISVWSKVVKIAWQLMILTGISRSCKRNTCQMMLHVFHLSSGSIFSKITCMFWKYAQKCIWMLYKCLHARCVQKYFFARINTSRTNYHSIP